MMPPSLLPDAATWTEQRANSTGEVRNARKHSPHACSASHRVAASPLCPTARCDPNEPTVLLSSLPPSLSSTLPFLLPPQLAPLRAVSASSSLSPSEAVEWPPSDVRSEWPLVAATGSGAAERLSPVEEAAMIEENHLFAPSSAQLRLTRLYSDVNEGRARKRQSQRRSADSASDDDAAALHDEHSEAHAATGVRGRPVGFGTASSTSVSLVWLRVNTATHRWRKRLCRRRCSSLNVASIVRTCWLSIGVALIILILTVASWLGTPSHVQSVKVSLPIDLSDNATLASASELLWGSAALSSSRIDGGLPVHVIASCANRLTALRYCLPTWLSVPEVSSVTIVDWGSAQPLHDELRDEIEQLNGRLRVVTLAEPLPWMLSTSVNLALHFVPLSTPSLLLKLDCDSVLHSEFVQQHPLSEHEFYAGNWRVARDENELHLNGVLFIHTLSFLRVNGYDERLQSYGYDDSNLHERLEAANITARPLRYQHIEHLRHDDSLRRQASRQQHMVEGEQHRTAQRRQYTAGGQASVASVSSLSVQSIDWLIDIAPPFFATQLHRVLLEAVPLWNASMSGAIFRISATRQPHTYHASLQELPVRLESSVSTARWLHAVREAAEITLRRVGLRVDELPKADDMYQHVYYLMRLTCFWTTDSEQPSLIVHVQRGLSNRLLALASAASVAAAVGMPLKLIWLSDQYCEATFSNLFRLRDELSAQSLRSLNSSALLSVSQLRSQDVWESSTSLPAVQLLSSSRYELYNYMEPEEGAIKNKPIEIASGSRRKSVYIKSADRLSHDAGLDDANLHHALSSLVLSEAVAAHVSSLRQRWMGEESQREPVDAGSLHVAALDTAIGVHIRHQPPREEAADSHSYEYQLLATARQLSTADVYARALFSAASEPQQRFYVSSDDTATIAELKAALGSDRIMHLSDKVCNDCSVRCSQQALADQLLLGQSSRLLGSVWSTFSEVAGLWRLRVVSYPPEISELLERANAAAATSSTEKWRAVATTRSVLLSSELLTAPFTDPRIASFVLPPSARTTQCHIELVSLLGERCSGTSYLQRLLEENFDLSSTDDYHHRHFFGFEQVKHPYRHSECVLFLGVIREPMEWLECFYKCQWQLDQWRYLDWQSFLTLPIVSYAESEMNYTLSQLPVADRAAAHQAMLDKPIWHDRNFDDSQLRQWQDVFQLRRVKASYMLDAFPNKVANYVMVRLEDLSTHPQHFLHILQLWFNIRPKGRQTADYIEHLTAHSPLASYKEVDMDDDVSNDVDLRRDAAHDHASAEVRETVWQQLDNELEARVGYTVHGANGEISG